MKKERNKNPIQPVSGTKVPRYAGPSTFARLPELRDVESCDVAIVGVPFEDNAVSATGVAYMFDIFTGELVHTFDNPDPTLDDQFGNAVAISENYVAIGVPRDDDSGVVNTGRTYVYSIYE